MAQQECRKHKSTFVRNHTTFTPVRLMRRFKWLRDYFILALLIIIFISLFIKKSHAQITASFTFAPTAPPCGSATFNFTDQTTGGTPALYQWTWDFDGSIVTGVQNPSRNYIAPGVYTVTLTVTDGTFTDDTTQFVQVFNLPVPDFTSDTQVVCAGVPVQFIDLSISADGLIDTWRWIWNDGSPDDTIQSPMHAWNVAGTYNVTLEVTDNNLCTAIKDSVAYMVINPKPIADFSYSVQPYCNLPAVANFTDITFGQGPFSYIWSFGDAGVSIQQNPSHNYNSEGTYTVVMIATNTFGCSDTMIKPGIMNIDDFDAAFSADDTVVCVGQLIQFSDSSSASANFWSWDFGDNGASGLQNPVYAYSTPGVYDVMLTVTNPNGCIATAAYTSYITVNPSPVANFSASDSSACQAPFNVSFTDLSVGAVSWLWNFGDGNTSSSQNPSHTYFSTGNFYVSLVITNSDGCNDTMYKGNFIHINPPLAGFDIDTAFGCFPRTVNFTDTTNSFDPIVSWIWNFGNGNTSNAQNPSTVYNSDGFFTVTLIVQTSDGCIDTATSIVGAGTTPAASFNVSPDTACRLNPVTFVSTSTNADSIVWLFGDGATGSGDSVTHLYPDTGFYTVTIIAFNKGCPDSLTVNNAVYINPPVAAFTMNNSIGCSVPFSVQFTNQSIGATSRVWKFGDGSPNSTINNPNHTYITAGDFTVTLVVTNNVTGCVDSTQALIRVSSTAANFVADTLEGCVPLTVSFTDLSSTQFAGHSIISWQWSFGDGATSSLQNPTNTYTLPGLQTVSLVIFDNIGCTDTVSIQDYIFPRGPLVYLSASTYQSCVGSPIQFTDSSVTTDPSYPITGWSWNFGDGTTSNLQNPIHAYTDTGTYIVFLTVTDSLGCNNTGILPSTITITQPEAIFSASQTGNPSITIFCPDNLVLFNNSSTGGNLSYQWDFGDGTTSTLFNPSHLYASLDSSYTVTLVVTDSGGCTDTASLNILTILPHAEFTLQNLADTFSTCPIHQPQFIDSSSGGIIGWAWTFGNGVTSFQQNPNPAYPVPGVYTVTLIATSFTGCVDTMIKNNYITVAGPTGSFTYDVDSGCAPLTVTFIGIAANSVQYTWDFGDGFTVTNTSPDPDTVIHTYTVPGIYFPTLILTDSAGCVVTYANNYIVIGDIPFADFTYSTQNVCVGLNVQFTDLSVPTHPQNPDPYPVVQWFWDFGDATTSTLQNPIHSYVTAGSYTVSLTVTNTFGCTDSVVMTALINVYDPLQAGFSMSDDVVCRNDIISFTDTSVINAGPIVSWLWDFGDGSTSNLQNPSHSYTNGGVFTVTLTVTDTVGCVSTINQTVYVIGANAGSDQQICQNAASALLNGNTPVHPSVTGTWTTSSSAVITNPGSPSTSVTNISSTGTYTFTWTFTNGTCSDSDQVIITVDSLELSSAGADIFQCADTLSANLSANTPGIGTGVWTTAGTANIASPNSSSTSVSNLSVGINFFVWTITNGTCISSDTVTVLVNALPVADAGNNVFVAPGIPVIIGGSPTATGGTPPYTYLWTPSGTLNDSSLANPTATDSATTTYYLLVTDSFGCTSVDSITIFVNFPPLAVDDTVSTLEDTPVIIAHLSNDFDPDGIIDSSSVIIIGGPSNGTAVYNPVTGTITYTPNLNFFGTDTIIYILCDTGIPVFCDTALIIITVIPVNDAPVAANDTIVFCTATSDSVYVLINDNDVEGDSLSISILTNPQNGTASVAGATIIYVNNPGFTGADSLAYVVCDNGNPVLCDTAWVLLYVSQNPVVTHTVTNALCNSDSTGIIDLTVTGTSPFTYLWSNGATSQDLNGVPAGNYSAIITDSAGCSSVDSATVTEPAALNATSTAFAPACAGQNSGSIQVNVTGGTTPYSFYWSTGDTTQNLTLVAPGIYYLTITDTNNCLFYLSDTVPATPNPLSITSTSLNVVCFGDSTGSISLSVSGGSPVYSYSWNTGDSAQSISGLLPGSYSVIVTDAGGCTQTDTIIITQPPSALIIDSSSVTDANCLAGIQGSIQVAVSGGNPGYAYMWNNGATTQSLSSLNAGTYTITITDSGGCAIQQTYVVDELGVLTISAAGDTVICANEVTVLSTASISGFNYQWSVNGNLIPGATTNSITVTAQGIYILTVSGSCGTFNSNAVTVTVLPVPVLQYIASANTICPGNLVQLSMAGASSYSWSPYATLSDSTGPNVTAAPQVTTTYTIIGIDTAGCRDTISITLEVDCDSLFIPNGFSPDGNSMNDFFEVKGVENYPGNNVKIFNRWGNLVWEGSDYDNQTVYWDGTSNKGGISFGEKLPNGTYYYVIDLGDGSEGYAGYVVLKR